MMRWELFDKAVNAARMVAQDDDIARDAAINALEECGQAPEGHILRRARDRAKDLIRAERRSPQVIHADVDTFASSENVEETVARNEHERNLLGAIGLVHGTIYGFVQQGYTNAEIADKLGVAEETARKMRKAAERAVEDHSEKGH